MTEDMITLESDSGGGIPEMVVSAEGKNLINVTVENESLENVVAMFTRLSGANIVATSADLEGTVTVNLTGVEWRPALSSILEVHNLALVEKLPGSGVYTIVPRPADMTEPLVVETVFLKYTTVPELMPIIKAMTASVSNSSLSEFSSRNAMVLRTTEANVREVRSMVEQMDVPSKQVCVETKFMELNDEASKQLGIRWDSLEELGATFNAGPFSYNRDIERGATRENTQSYSDQRNSSDARNWSQNYESTQDKLFDKDDLQVEDLELSIFDPNPNVDGDEIIVQKVVPTTIDSSSSSQSGSRERTHITTEGLTRDLADTFAKTIAESQAAILDIDSFEVVLSALKKTDGVSVISNPKIIVSSGSTNAFFSVGEREPIIKTEVTYGTQDSPGDKVTAELDTGINTDYIKDGYLETGIHLYVVPVVKTEEMIEAYIEPKLVRRVLPDKVVGENSWPRISVKEIRTKFTLRSGQTVAIGGLTDTSDDKKRTSVPLLGDIPLIGKYLFSHVSDMKRQIETIIFVTLSMAQADSLFAEAGIPQNAELVHKRMIQDRATRSQFEADLELLQQETEEETVQRVKSRLLQRRK